MKEDYGQYKKLFGQMKEERPSAQLLHTVLLRVEEERLRVAKVKLFFSGIFTIASLGAFVPVLRYAGAELASSGFLQYFSLLFSDSATIISFWKEISLSLAETLPVFGVALIFAVLLALLSSLKILAESFASLSARHNNVITV